MRTETVLQRDGVKLGYVVIVNREEQGYIGGYLCADERGVPIEFWHTVDAPIKTSRLQELLYGKTLKPELLGKNIACALLGHSSENSKTRPTMLLTEEEAVLLGFDLPEVPILQVAGVASDLELGKQGLIRRINTAAGEVLVRWREENASEVEQLIPRLGKVDVLEPFVRIRALLNELGGKGPEKSGE